MKRKSIKLYLSYNIMTFSTDTSWSDIDVNTLPVEGEVIPVIGEKKTVR